MARPRASLLPGHSCTNSWSWLGALLPPDAHSLLCSFQHAPLGTHIPKRPWQCHGFTPTFRLQLWENSPCWTLKGLH